MKMVSGNEEGLLGLIERCIGPVINIIIVMIQEYRNTNTKKLDTRNKKKKDRLDLSQVITSSFGNKTVCQVSREDGGEGGR